MEDVVGKVDDFVRTKSAMQQHNYVVGVGRGQICVPTLTTMVSFSRLQ